MISCVTTISNIQCDKYIRILDNVSYVRFGLSLVVFGLLQAINLVFYALRFMFLSENDCACQ